MTTEKWQLYSQTGVDGPEYGVRIRTGYTVVGFQKEDAQAIVAWQNASIQPEGDIMEKAKALRNAALPRQTYSIPGQTGYGNPSLSKGWDFSAVDELVRVVVLELIAEVERLRSLNESLMENGNDLRTRCQKAEARIKELQDLIDKPPEEADWVADYHLLQSALDGPIIDAARKWHAAYRNAQNSNLMRAKEVKRLRSVPAWEVTEERIAAMKDACNFLVYAEIRNKGVNPGSVDRAKNAEDVLRAMLAGGKRDA